MPDLTFRNQVRAQVTAALTPTAARLLGGASAKLRNVSQNANNWDLRLNGEAFTIQRACDSGAVIFDVGANEGAWARAALDLIPSATLHCFEPVPASFDKLSEAVGSDQRVSVTNVALGSAPGIETFTIGSESSEIASKYEQDPHFVHGTINTITVRVGTGDGYVRERGITRIDLLKVDVEGMELEALRGFSDSLSAGVVRVVQFEYGVGYIGARAYLKDVMELLEAHGFDLFTSMPRSWQPVRYHYSMEDFNARNFVAVRRDDSG